MKKNKNYTYTMQGDIISTTVVSLDRPLSKIQVADVMDLLKTKTTWFTDGYTGEQWGYANISKKASLNGFMFNKIELHNALWGEKDGMEILLKATIYAEVC